jgi:hypothetical protein
MPLSSRTEPKVLIMFARSNDPKHLLGERISDGLSHLVQGLFWLGLAIAAWVVLSRYTRAVEMPNGAVLTYRPDLTYEMRIDLFRPNGFRPVIQAIDKICYNDKAIWVSTLDYRAFVWPSLAADPLPASSKHYFQTLKQSGLLSKNNNCNGYYPTSLDAGLLVEGLCPVIPGPTRQGRPLSKFPSRACDPTPLPLAWPDEDPSAKR